MIIARPAAPDHAQIPTPAAVPTEAKATLDPSHADRQWLALNPALPPTLPSHTVVFYPTHGPLAWAPRKAEPTAFDSSWESRYSAWRAGGPEPSRAVPAGVRYRDAETPSRIDRGFGDDDMAAVGACG